MKNILFTGPPACGKSTLIERILPFLERPSTGFFTREIRDRGKRRGFLIETLDGKRGALAGPGVNGCAIGIIRFGRYAVSLEDIDRVAVPSMIPNRPGEVVVVDEIGKMECLSTLFRETLLGALDSPHPVIATVALRGTPFIEAIKAREDVLVILVSEKNRDLLARDFIARDPPFQRVS
jgi:nucleoside-triphosphatase THEP1